jgi:hypothetical protein
VVQQTQQIGDPSGIRAVTVEADGLMAVGAECRGVNLLMGLGGDVIVWRPSKGANQLHGGSVCHTASPQKRKDQDSPSVSAMMLTDKSKTAPHPTRKNQPPFSVKSSMRYTH